MRRNRAMAKNAALLAASVMVWCGGANATPSCQGTYAATPLQPLPERVVLDLDLHDRSKRSLVLADRFLKGLREAWIAAPHGWETHPQVLTAQNRPIPSSAASRAAECGQGCRQYLPRARERHGLHLRRSGCCSCGWTRQ